MHLKDKQKDKQEETKDTRIYLLTWVVMLAVTMWTPQGRADTIVVPNSLTAMEGDLNTGLPFNTGAFHDISATMRNQQVFASSEFVFLSGPQLITQIAFRPDADAGAPFSSTLPNIQINFSTTTAVPHGLSATFANNVGLDDTVVFSGVLSVSSAFTGGPAPRPKDFDIVISLQTPFLYDPTAGNLLLDVRNFSGGTTTQFDAHFGVGLPVSRVASVFSGVNSPTADPPVINDFTGLVVQFTTTPVTEPATLTLVLTAGLILLSMNGGLGQLFSCLTRQCTGRGKKPRRRWPCSVNRVIELYSPSIHS